MTPEELGRIREIYEQALPMSGADRQAHLNQVCQGEPDIREGVERLLQARDNIPTWLDQPAVGAAKPFAAPEPPQMEGRHFSGYTLIRKIGRGGMGAVYLAERSDETFHRRAAIKLVLPPANSAAVIERFQQEREILASLDHPNIAKLLDAGVTEEGWPYFVMEYVDGQPIHRWCDDRKLNISQRLELFRGVIDAVRYAHQHLVVHRDLKPGNIFVTNEGVVKLLDFGIAKVLSGTAAGQALDTRTLTSMMTPEYASPEQVNGEPVTTQSDVYSLGVVLYELLTGHRPYRLLSAALHEIARVIAEQEPARPSDVVATTEPAFSRNAIQTTPEAVSAAREGDQIRLRKRLRGDLDSILLMALRKEPERRYGSVDSFAEDLQRHLEHRPVMAREAGPWERLVGFWRRNNGGFFAGAVIAFIFFWGTAAVVWQARYDIRAAALDPRMEPFLAPLMYFSYGLSVTALFATVYFARVSGAIAPLGTRTGKMDRIGGLAGGLVWALGMMGQWRIERDLGWWHSRIGDDFDLLLLSALSFWTYVATGGAVLTILVMIRRRFGWKGQAIALVLFGLGQAVRERIWFGKIIPALAFEPGAVPILVSGGIIIASGLIAIVVRSVIARLGAKSTAVNP